MNLIVTARATKFDGTVTTGSATTTISPAPIPPSPSSVQWGAAIYPYPNTSHSKQSEYTLYSADCGVPDLLRVYLAPADSTLAAFNPAWPIKGELSDWNSRGTIFSGKFELAKFSQGLYDTKFLQFCQNYQNSTGKDLKVAIHHEVEDDIKAGSQSLADWRGANTRMVNLLQTHGFSKIKPWVILMGYTWEAASQRNPDDYWIPGMYGYAVDQYNMPSARHDSTAWRSPANLMDPFTNWCRRSDRNVKMGWAEIGCAPDFASKQRRPDWITSAAQYLIDKGYEFGSYFDMSGPMGDWQVRVAIKRAKYFQDSTDIRNETILGIAADPDSALAWKNAQV